MGSRHDSRVGVLMCVFVWGVSLAPWTSWVHSLAGHLVVTFSVARAVGLCEGGVGDGLSAVWKSSRRLGSLALDGFGESGDAVKAAVQAIKGEMGHLRGCEEE